MTLDDVNERFPITKYKTWVAGRAEKGLSTAGGIDATNSRPASIKEPEHLDEESSEQSSSDPPRPPTSASSHAKSIEKDVPAALSEHLNEQDKASEERAPSSEHHEDADDDEDDPIQTAIPAEMLAAPGDSCAICIDTLEDDDDVRGLTCGHAFHASCVDPWLTSRRASCPLCKADYYVPKARPEGEQPQDSERPTGRRSTMHSMRLDVQPNPTFGILPTRRGERPRPARHNHSRRSTEAETTPQGASRFFRLPRFRASPVRSPTAITTPQPSQNWANRLPSMPRPQVAFWRRRNNNASANEGTEMDVTSPHPTPGQLEAGTQQS